MKRSMLVWSACAAVCCTGRLAFGALDTSAATTLVMREGDSGYNTSLTNASRWAANAGGTAVAPQLMDGNASPNPAASGYDYYVGSSKTLRTFKFDSSPSPFAGKLISFGGRSLHFGSNSQFWPASISSDFPLEIADLHFQGASRVYLATNGGITNSTVTVEATTNNPFSIINDNVANATATFSMNGCTLVGDGAAGIVVGGANLTGKATGFFYSGDGSGYLGTIKCLPLAKPVEFTLGAGTDLSHATIELGAAGADSSATLNMANGNPISIGTLTIVHSGYLANSKASASIGTLNLCEGGSIYNKTQTGVFSIGTFNQTGGNMTFNSSHYIAPQTYNLTGGYVKLGQLATIDITTLDGSSGDVILAYNYNVSAHANGCATVTDSFTGPVSLQFSTEFARDLTTNSVSPQTVLVIRKREGATAPTPADFAVSFPDFPTLNGLVSVTVEDDDENGVWNVKTPASFVRLLADHTLEYAWAAEANKNAWSDGRTPHADADYFSQYKFYTYINNTDENLCEFVMRSLTLYKSELWVNHNMRFRKIILSATKDGTGQFLNAGSLVTSGTCNLRITGDEIYVSANDAGNLRPYGGAIQNIDAPLTGSGMLQTLNRGTAKPDNVATNYGASTVNLLRASPDFTGKIRTWKYAGGTYPYSLEDSTKLGIAVPLALGGPLDTFMFDALELNLFGCLKPLASMTLDTANRGIFVNWFGRMLVESNLVFHVNERLTMGGTLEKMGAGTLWLGASAAPKFTGAQLADPPSAAGADGTNVVRVLEGALGATTTNAVDGLALFFAEGGKLAVDAATTGDVAAYGLYNKKGTVTFDGANLGVAVTPPTAEVGYAAVGVLTVPTAQAAAFLDGTKPRLEADAIKGYRTWFSYEEDAVAGLTTFKVTVARAGMTIIFR